MTQISNFQADLFLFPSNFPLCFVIPIFILNFSPAFQLSGSFCPIIHLSSGADKAVLPTSLAVISQLVREESTLLRASCSNSLAVFSSLIRTESTLLQASCSNYLTESTLLQASCSNSLIFGREESTLLRASCSNSLFFGSASELSVTHSVWIRNGVSLAAG